jgi:hypothetical protein
LFGIYQTSRPDGENSGNGLAATLQNAPAIVHGIPCRLVHTFFSIVLALLASVARVALTRGCCSPNPGGSRCRRQTGEICHVTGLDQSANIIGMFALEPANPDVVSRWRNFAFANVGLSSAIGIATQVNRVFPKEMLERFPQHSALMYAAFAIALISALFLTIVPKVISVSFAQLGALTSLLYIGYSLAGIFLSLMPVFYALMGLAILVMILVFSQSIAFFARRKAYADLALGLVFIAAAVFFCSYPLYMLSHLPA